MKEYIKPNLEEENVEIEDIIAVSIGESTQGGKVVNPWDTWADED